MAATDAHQTGIVKPPGHAFGFIRLDPEMLGNGIYGHIPLESVAGKVADRPHKGTLVGHDPVTHLSLEQSAL
jgi:hypothetical protein